MRRFEAIFVPQAAGTYPVVPFCLWNIELGWFMVRRSNGMKNRRKSLNVY